MRKLRSVGRVIVVAGLVLHPVGQLVVPVCPTLVRLTAAACKWLAVKGYEPSFGARPLARVIQEHIKKPLAEEILFGKLQGGGIVRVLVEKKDGKETLGFEFLDANAPAKPKGEGKSKPKKRKSSRSKEETA